MTLQQPSGKDAERREQGSVNAKDPETEKDGFVNHRSDSGQKRPVYLRDRTYCQNLPCLVEYVGDLRSRDIQYSKNSVDFLMMFDPPKVVKSSPTKFDHMYLQLWLIHTSFFDNPPRLFGIAHFNHPKMVKLLQSPVHIGTYILQLRFFEPT